ncbi:DNA mismatch repair endonuclease MutL [Sporanaerobium hydrogeniformans]|uniref:DNA mismatch repair endonuclease MutL n=1 Tax=Sporanaerobium hydrogeniformans TaxID=3072179 RepID=UPI0015D47C46|nr:DNA mismatch repair endonuclease MutL [Sporanaerobium hydrogeniformans]
MSEIKLLDTHTINKIAAGEVVERPCSVIKELVENSIDAKASSITLEIKQGGIDFIRVTDNGVGIPKEEVEVAFLRHATSKIETAEDLQKVLTLGFRGEALASIAAVSHVELLTKTSQDLTGKRLEVSGGKIGISEEVACPNGTTFMMRHLFYNVPARKEFLGSSSSEGAKITDYISRLALAHPEISFKYIQNNKLLFTTSGNHDLTQAVLQVYGKEAAKNVMPLYDEEEGITCTGLLGNTLLTRANRNYEHFFINGRTIKSTLLQRAVEDAYKTLVMVGKFPFVLLHLTLDPATIDVNVHPTKMQVRFREEERIYQMVYKAITKELRKNHLVPEVLKNQLLPTTPLRPSKEELKATEQLFVETFFAPQKSLETPTPESLLGTTHSSYLKEPIHLTKEERFFGSTNSEKTFLPDSSDHSYITTMQERREGVSEKICSSVTDGTSQEKVETSPVRSYRIVGQFFNTYWLIEYEGKIYIIDQHAAHERLLYERFMCQFKKGESPSQLLLIPETLHLTPSERALFEQEAGLFQKLGFQIEGFGETDLVIREVPFILNQPLSPSIVRDLLDQLEEIKPKDLTVFKEGTIIKMACRSAVKAHDKLTPLECQKLIEELMDLENPFTCPHGRPTLVALTQMDIEKMFKRIT